MNCFYKTYKFRNLLHAAGLVHPSDNFLFWFNKILSSHHITCSPAPSEWCIFSWAYHCQRGPRHPPPPGLCWLQLLWRMLSFPPWPPGPSHTPGLTDTSPWSGRRSSSSSSWWCRAGRPRYRTQWSPPTPVGKYRSIQSFERGLQTAPINSI